MSTDAKVAITIFAVAMVATSAWASPPCAAATPTASSGLSAAARSA